MEELYSLEPKIKKVCESLIGTNYTYSLQFYDSDFLFSKGLFVVMIHNATKGVNHIVDIMRIVSELGLKAFTDELKEKRLIYIAIVRPDFDRFSYMLTSLLDKCGLASGTKSTPRAYPHTPYQNAFDYLLAQTKIRILMPDKKSPEENTFMSLCRKFYLSPESTLYPEVVGLRTEKIVEFELSMPEIRKSLRKKLGLPS